MSEGESGRERAGRRRKERERGRESELEKTHVHGNAPQEEGLRVVVQICEEVAPITEKNEKWRKMRKSPD